ncbi:hypothetical protein M430DRAFT_17439 [Amorphotheca resinae ATCC 22711]|uniref:HNH nuclease domain-containing protein n=1 Tax=Amorphotheca resinae ATCC 22711 TaxID=857342 RepID=A0A2T3B542_AMORE|nr:hypothetical protein M430DRAFT_17439 [Amorphotheca resinae ATCC 22711]PSS21866.1 hypothetical protein M430DRAFT_17439 [Amorphotheca resinae ATCC 22711]
MASLQPSDDYRPSDEDYNQPSAERRVVLQRLQDFLGDVPVHFWALAHVCDVKTLEEFAEKAEADPVPYRISIYQTPAMIAAWTQSLKGCSRTSSRTSSRMSSAQPSPQFRAQPPASSPLADPDPSPSKKRKIDNFSGSSVQTSPGFRAQLPPSSPLEDPHPSPAKRRWFENVSLNRSDSEKEKAAARDQNRCVLTGMGVTDVAHIYPFCLMKREDDTFGKRHLFWAMLELFWPKEKVKAWEKEIFPNGTHENGVESATNLITLSKDTHSAWNKGNFALKPLSVSGNKTCLKVQFFWQTKCKQTWPLMSLLTTPASTKDLCRGDDNVQLPKITGERKLDAIETGDIFEIKTDDPQARPLPSFALLEMQWHLQRIAGMAGAADVDEDLKEWDDDDISNLGLDER